MECKASKSYLVFCLALFLCLGVGLVLLPFSLDGLPAAAGISRGGQEEGADRIGAAATEDVVVEEPAGTRVREDRTAGFLVQVVDRRGRPRAGVPVGLFFTEKDVSINRTDIGSSSDFFLFRQGETTGEEGIAGFDLHAVVQDQGELLERWLRFLYVDFAFPLEKRRLARITTALARKKRLRLLLPPTGQVVVHTGCAQSRQPDAPVSIYMGYGGLTKVLAPKAKRSFTSFPLFSRVGTSPLTFPHVGLGLELGVWCVTLVQGGQPWVYGELVGPGYVGQTVATKLVPTSSQPFPTRLVTGFAEDERGRLIRDGCIFMAGTVNDPWGRIEDSWGYFSSFGLGKEHCLATDDRGRFTCSLGAKVRKFLLVYPLPGHLRQDWARAVCSGPFPDSTMNLGRVTFRRPPVVCAGRVVNLRGAPRAGCRLELKYEGESRGKEDERMTDSKGRFTFRTWRPRQPIRLRCRYDRHSSGVTVTPVWGNRECRLEFPELVEVKGEAIPKSVYGLLVRFIPLSGPGYVHDHHTAAPLSRGTYATKLPPGTYRVSFRLHNEEVLAIPALKVHPGKSPQHPLLSLVDLTCNIKPILLQLSFPGPPPRRPTIYIEDGRHRFRSPSMTRDGRIHFHVANRVENVIISIPGYEPAKAPLQKQESLVKLIKQQ